MNAVPNVFSRRNFLRSAIGLAATASLARAQQRSVVDALMAGVPAWMAAADVPGCSVAWIQDAQIAWTQGFGAKIAGETERVDDQTVFEAASLTKPVAAYLALKLVETGQLDLDQPVTEILEASITDESSERVTKITARHLLSHSSGFPNWRASGRPLRVYNDPGTRFRYSGEGFMVVQKIIEQLAGEPLDAYAQRNLFDPFELESAGLVWRDDYATRMAGGHDPSRNIHGARSKRTKPNAAASLVCTASDYARFVCEILNPRAADNVHLSRGTIAQMLSPQINVAERLYWGLGWGLQKSPDYQSFWHWGNQNEVYHNFVIANPTTQSGIVVFTNGRNGRQVYGPAVRTAMGDDQPSLDWAGA